MKDMGKRRQGIAKTFGQENNLCNHTLNGYKQAK